MMSLMKRKKRDDVAKEKALREKERKVSKKEGS
jgi:hypothetical protein